MSSFTSEAVTSASFQGAPPPRPARSDQLPGNDSFGALVDSSTAADTSNDRANSTAQEQSASRRRSDDASAAADRRQSRNAASADRAAQNDSDDRDAAIRQRSDANADSHTDAVQHSRTKSGASKPEDAKSTAKSNSDDAPTAHAEAASVADPAAPAQQDGPAVTTPNPVAVPIPVTVAPAIVPAASPASGKATEPLAIAAAAIAASSAATDAPAASAAQTKIDASATAATASPAANATTADAAATAKINVQAASETAATPVNQPAAQTDATAATGAELTAAVAAPASVAPKARTAGVTQTGTTASSDPETAPDTVDPSATAISTGSALNGVAQGPAVAGKPKAGNGGIDGIKADNPSANSSSTIATNISAREHSAVAEAGHAAADPTDIGVQATGAIQPQLHSSAAAAAPVGPLNVTAATNAAVPLSGLALEIAVSAKSGKSRFEIRLDPADLGRIDVRIDVDRNGQVTSHLTVEKPETLSMLRQDAPQLQRALDDAGLRTGNGGLQFSLRDQSSSGQDNGSGSGRNAHRLIVEEDSIPAAVAGRTYGRRLGSSSGVDIKV